MASSDFCCEEQLKKFNTAEFLTDVLTNSPEKPEYYRELPPKGTRTNLFYISDLTKTSLRNISADDKGANLKSRITNKSYFYGNDQVIKVHEVTTNESHTIRTPKFMFQLIMSYHFREYMEKQRVSL